MTRKICVVVTARPTYSRIKSGLAAIAARNDTDLQLVLAGSAILERYGNVSNVIAEDGFEVTARVESVIEGDTLSAQARTTAATLSELASLFSWLKPDAVVTVADRYETIATAIAASYQNIPLVHVQGGEVTGSIDEKVRHAITKLADLHFTSTRLAAERVRRMGEDAGSVHCTGCPSIDLAATILEDPELGFHPLERYGGVGPMLDLADGYLVVMQHPVTFEYKEAAQQITETMEAVCELGYPTLWFWPNVDAGSDSVSKAIRRYRERGRVGNVHFFRNMRPQDFLRLMLNSRGIVGNSSVAIREGAFLGVPAVNIGSRQQGRERGRNVIDVDYDRRAIGDAIERNLANGRYPSDHVYGDGQAGTRIAELLATLPLRYEKRLNYD